MARRKLNYKEGDWFAVPLGGAGYALGLVARVGRRGVTFGYFFGPRRVTLLCVGDPYPGVCRRRRLSTSDGRTAIT